MFMMKRMDSALITMRRPNVETLLIIKKMFRPARMNSEMMLKFLRPGWF